MAQNDFNIGLVAGLDGTKSKEKINQDIDAIQKSLKELELKAKLNPNQVKAIEAQLNNLKVNLTNVSFDQKSLNNLVSQINNSLQEIKLQIPNLNTGYAVSQAKQTGQQIGQNITQGINSSVSQAKSAIKSFSDLTNFSELNKKIRPIQIDASELKNYQNILANIKNTYSEFGQVKITNETFNNGILEKFKVNIEQVNGDLKETKSFTMSLTDNRDAFVFDGVIKGAESVVQHLDKAKNAVNQTAEAINASKINNIQLSIGSNGKIATDIETLRNNFTKLGLSANEVKTKMSGVDTELSKLKSLMSSGANNSAITAQFDKLQTSLKQTENSLKQTRSEYSLLATTQQRLSLANSIEAWNQKNSAATKSVRAENDRYVASLRDLDTQMTKLQFGQIQTGFKQAENSMRGLSKLGASFKDQMKQAAGSFTQWLSVSSGIMALVYQLKKIPEEVIKIDTAITELRKVSNASDIEITNYFDKAAESAKKLGASVSDVISATADWSRLGYNLPDSEELAKVATLYTNVGDNIDMDAANQSLISTLQGFKMNASDAMHIIDSFNEVGNNFAISSDGIGQALQKSASSMYAAGNTLEESIGLITAANGVVQDPDSIGTAYKTISMRIRGAKTELEEMGADTDGMVSSTAKLQKEILALSGIDIMKDKNTFKSTYQILDELSQKWIDLTDIQQASITELIAGKRQGNVISALMSNFDVAREARDSAMNSTGSALKEQEEYEKSIQYSLDRLEASYQEFSNNILNSELLKRIVDFGNTTINTIDKVTSALGSLGSIGLGAGLLSSFKNVGREKCYPSYRVCL